MARRLCAVRPREAILTTWDAFVDELWGDAPDEGATLIAATFPRAYVDVNRAEDDIDPELLATPWPAPLRPTAYSARGMGLIRRNALPNVPMYAAPLSVAAVERRSATTTSRTAARSSSTARARRSASAVLGTSTAIQ